MFPKKSLKVLLSIFTITLLVGLGFRVALALNYIDFSGTDTQDIRWPAGQTLSFVQGGAERTRIDATTGNVVIPQGLTVSGTFNMTGTYTGSVSAGNVTSGDFGSNYSGGNFSFPANVGIGTTAPGGILDIAGAGAGSTDVMIRSTKTDSTGESAALLFKTSGTQTVGIINGFDQDYVSSGQYMADALVIRSLRSGGLNLAAENASGDIRFYPGSVGTPALTVYRSGNVGIGTTSPASKLHIPNVNLNSAASGLTLEGGWPWTYYKDNETNQPSWVVYGDNNFYVRSVPYADRNSSDLSTVGNIWLTIGTGGNVGIGTTGPGYGLDVVSDSYVRIGTKTNIGNFLYLNKYSSATSNNLVYQTAGIINARIRMGDGVTNRLDIDDGTTGNERLSIRLDTGNVGIGTTGPQSKLNVLTGGTSFTVPNHGELGASTSARFLLHGAEPGVMLSSDYTTTQTGTETRLIGMQIGVYGSGDVRPQIYYGGQSLEFVQTTPNGSTANRRMVIDTSGNVGIGTVPKTWDTWYNPMQIGAGGFLFGHDSSPASAGFGSNVYISSGHKRVGVGQAVLIDTEGGTFQFMTAPSGAADSAISWTNALNILNSGNVGIGTTSPGYPLDVASDGEFKIRARNTNTGAGQNAYMTIDTASTAGESYLEFRTGQQGSTYGFIEYNRDGSLRFETSGHNDRMTIHSSGNVGIGTTSPGYKLDVAGAINSTGGIITPDIQFYGSQKIYNGDNSYLYIRSNSTSGAIRLMNNSTSSVGYLYGDGSSFGFLTTGGNWAVYMDQSSNWYSSRMYDKDSAGYYMDPASTSVTNVVQSNSYFLRGCHSCGYLAGSYNNIGGNSTYSNPIYTIGTDYAPSDSSLNNIYGIGYPHGNWWGSAGGRPAGWGMYAAANGDIRVILDAENGIVWSSASTRSPIFYDSDNTGYYVDRASTSNLNAANFAGNVGIGTSP